MPAEHTPSWYAASLPAIAQWPALDLDLDVDVCVIGGGFTGVNCALELAQRGCSVVLLEARRIGWGASGRNGGQLIRGLGQDPQFLQDVLGNEGVQRLRQYGLEAVDLLRQRIETFNIDCDLRWGHCELATRRRHLRNLQHEQEQLQQLGYRHPLRLLQRQDMAEVVDSRAYCGGLIDMGSGHLHPLRLLLGEAQAASRLGARLYEGSPVLDIHYGHRPQVQTPLASVRCNRLVLAADAHLGELQPWLTSRALPATSYLIATAPLGRQRARQLIPQDMALCDQRVAPDYYRLSRDHRLLFGAACHYSGRDPADIAGYLRARMLKVLPQLADVAIDYAWSGQIGISANRMPQLGRLPQHPSVLYAQGYSGHGLNISHLSARLLAEAIIGHAQTGFDLFSHIPHRHFPGGRWLRSPLLALGMAWEQLKERL